MAQGAADSKVRGRWSARSADVTSMVCQRLTGFLLCLPASLLVLCRHGLQVCSSSKGVSPAELAQCRLALGLALGKMARMTVVPQRDRSDYRCVTVLASTPECSHTRQASTSSAPLWLHTYPGCLRSRWTC